MIRACDSPGFRAVRILGEGGTAEVAEVHVEALGRRAALKYPKAVKSVEQIDFLKLLERELKLVRGLDYPGLVRVLGASTSEPVYLLMELCQGPSLEKAGRIDNLGLALNVISAAAAGLDYLRRKAIIHGDIKPQNIFLPSDWQSLESNNSRLFYVKLSDFSLGRFTDEPDAARAGAGTVGYMAPETITDGRTSPASDLFALGVTAYQVLTGRHPFTDDLSDPVRTSSRVREEEPAALEDIVPGLPPTVASVITRLVSKGDQKRYQSGWHVCQALRAAGATYPYEKALHPRYFVDAALSYAENKRSLLELSDKEERRLDLLTDCDNSRLRLLLSGNFARNNLTFGGERFAFVSGVIWPACLRRQTMRTFSRASFKDKRAIVRCAVVGGIQEATSLGLATDPSLQAIPSALPGLVRSCLKTSTTKTWSLPAARSAERLSRHDLAARLYLQAGALAEAEQTAYQAAVASQGDHKPGSLSTLLSEIIDFARVTERESTACRLLMVKGDILKQSGEAEKAEAVYLEILRIYQALPVDRLLAETYKDLGDLYKMKQNFAAGIESLEHALEIYRELGDDLEISHTYNNLGNIHWTAHDIGGARRSYLKALRIQKRLDAKVDLASTLNNLGAVLGCVGQHRRAAVLANRSLELNKELGNKVEIARCLNNLACLTFMTGDYTRSVDSCLQSLAINRDIGTKKELLFNYENLSVFMTIAGRLKESLKYLKEGIALALQLEDKPHDATFNVEMGNVLTRMGRFGDAAASFAAAGKVADEIDDKDLRVLLDLGRAGLRYSVGDVDGARQLAMEARRMTAGGDKFSTMKVLLFLSRVTDDEKVVEEAFKMAREQGLAREETDLRFNRLEQELRQGQIEEAGRLGNELLPVFERITEYVELPRFHNIVASLRLTQGRCDNALNSSSLAFRLAQRDGLVPEMIAALTLSGQIRKRLGEYEACYRDYKNALELAKRVLAGIDNDADRTFYQNTPSLQLLVAEIKMLGRDLVRK